METIECAGFSGWAVISPGENRVYIEGLFEFLQEAVGLATHILDVGIWDVTISEFNYLP